MALELAVEGQSDTSSVLKSYLLSLPLKLVMINSISVNVPDNTLDVYVKYLTEYASLNQLSVTDSRLSIHHI